MYHPTKYWHKLDDGRVQCDVCPRACKMHDGQRGLCFVRGVEGGEVKLFTYGRSSGFCIDPIEKKPLNHFLPGTSVLSFGTAGCNLACKFCFHPDTLVATTGGTRRIAELFDECRDKVSHEQGSIAYPRSLQVWTREGQRARVAKVFAHPHSGSLLSLKASCCPPMLLTANHKVFAAHRSKPEAIERIEAGKLSSDYYLVVPKRRAARSELRIDVSTVLASIESRAHAPRTRRIPLSELIAALQSTGTSAELGATLGYHRAYVRTLRSGLARGVLSDEAPRPVRLRLQNGRVRFSAEKGAGVPQLLALNPDLAWLLGFYCAEGSIGQNRSRPNSYVLVFSCGHHEQALVERAARLLTQLFGLPTIIVKRRTTMTVEVRSSSLARLLEALCGRGAKGKRVPPQLLESPKQVMRAFLDGYFAGDGYFSPTHIVGNTVSQTLALGLFELGLHLDVLPSYFVHENPSTYRIEGREVTQSTTFIVKFARHRYEERERDFPERTIWRDAGDKFLVPVKKVETIPYEGPVYNLEVDDPDHSYLAPFLAVGNCQNWDMSKSREMDTLADRASPEQLAASAQRLGCASVAYTYNDPVVFMEYAMDVADACRERGVRSVAVTAGYMCPQPRAEFYSHMDAANVDLKAFTERFYRKICGAELGAVLETLEYLKHETKAWFEITTLLIPDENDSDAELDQMTRWIADKLGPDVPLHFTAFHPDWKMMDKQRTPAATLTRAREIAIRNGLRYVYTGNVHDPAGSSTYCAGCGTRLIERDWYQLGEWRLDEQGRCLQCSTQLPGVFNGAPGAWGARRLPVRIAV
jgi:pyruvate formate lyase activating enzyme